MAFDRQQSFVVDLTAQIQRSVSPLETAVEANAWIRRAEYINCRIDTPEQLPPNLLFDSILLLGTLIQSRQDHVELAADTEQLLRIDPDDWSKSRIAFGGYEQCIVLLNADSKVSDEERKRLQQVYSSRLEACRGDFEKYAQSSAEGLATFAVTLVEVDTQRAVRLLRQAVAMDASRARSWTLLGSALCRAQEWKDALEALQRGQSLGFLSPRDRVMNLYHQAIAHVHVDNSCEQARVIFDQAESLGGAAFGHTARIRAEAARLLGVDVSTAQP